MSAPVPAWFPDQATIENANVTEVARQLGFKSYQELHTWSVENRPAFWELVMDRLGIVFETSFDSIISPASTPQETDWLPCARLNIVQSCFQAEPNATAIKYELAGVRLQLTYNQLEVLVDRVAHGLGAADLAPGDPIAIAMPMTVEAVAAYLGIIKAGYVVVSIADSFAPEEIRTRLDIVGAAAVVTQGQFVRAGKTLPMYDKVVDAGAAKAIVVDPPAALRPEDISWNEFLGLAEPFSAVIGPPSTTTNILFSSGTTGEPKAIPWTQSTPIKAAMDAHFHQDVHQGDVLAWPTNLGWMMGPWLIYSALMNRAVLALYDDVPTGRGFGEFVEASGVTMLGVVPSVVRAWRESACMEGLDWSAIRAFSSTGEASNADDMVYLMGLGGSRPVIEYCGGTEIGGGYMTGTVVQPAVAAAFSTPALGVDICILDEAGRPAEEGELFLIPPSIGLSEDLIKRDHQEVYYADTPPGPNQEQLRRHGDQMVNLGGGYYRAQGRVDDTMNLGGIKMSAAELERTIAAASGVKEVAAVAVPQPGGGPSRLVAFAVMEAGIDADTTKVTMNQLLKTQLNPLFKLSDLIPIEALPRTASNKVMRRELRAVYGKN